MDKRLFLTFEINKYIDSKEIKTYVQVLVKNQMNLQKRLKALVEECNKKKEKIKINRIYILSKCSVNKIQFYFSKPTNDLKELKKDLNYMLIYLYNSNENIKKEAYDMLKYLGIEKF